MQIYQKKEVLAGVARYFFLIFEINFEYTFIRFEKYSSKLDISRSFIRIFVMVFK